MNAIFPVPALPSIAVFTVLQAHGEGFTAQNRQDLGKEEAIVVEAAKDESRRQRASSWSTSTLITPPKPRTENLDG